MPATRTYRHSPNSRYLQNMDEGRREEEWGPVIRCSRQPAMIRRANPTSKSLRSLAKFRTAARRLRAQTCRPNRSRCCGCSRPVTAPLRTAILGAACIGSSTSRPESVSSLRLRNSGSETGKADIQRPFPPRPAWTGCPRRSITASVDMCAVHIQRRRHAFPRSRLPARACDIRRKASCPQPACPECADGRSMLPPCPCQS